MAAWLALACSACGDSIPCRNSVDDYCATKGGGPCAQRAYSSALDVACTSNDGAARGFGTCEGYRTLRDLPNGNEAVVRTFDLEGDAPVAIVWRPDRGTSAGAQCLAGPPSFFVPERGGEDGSPCAHRYQDGGRAP